MDLIEKIWALSTIQGARHEVLGLEKIQGFVSIIQAIGQLNWQESAQMLKLYKHKHSYEH